MVLTIALLVKLMSWLPILLILNGKNVPIKKKRRKNKAIQLLEKKVKRLASSLEDAEKERDYNQRKVAALEASGGGAIAGQSVFGMDEEDPDKERKLDLLKVFSAKTKKCARLLPVPVSKFKVANARKTSSEAPEGEGAAEDAPLQPQMLQRLKCTKHRPVAPRPQHLLPQAEDSAVPQDDVDPDDMPWEPGQSFSKEPDLDEDDDSPVKKMTDFKSFGPPPLQKIRWFETTSDAATTATKMKRVVDCG